MFTRCYCSPLSKLVSSFHIGQRVQADFCGYGSVFSSLCLQSFEQAGLLFPYTRWNWWLINFAKHRRWLKAARHCAGCRGSVPRSGGRVTAALRAAQSDRDSRRQRFASGKFQPGNTNNIVIKMSNIQPGNTTHILLTTTSNFQPGNTNHVYINDNRKLSAWQS